MRKDFLINTPPPPLVTVRICFHELSTWFTESVMVRGASDIGIVKFTCLWNYLHTKYILYCKNNENVALDTLSVLQMSKKVNNSINGSLSMISRTKFILGICDVAYIYDISSMGDFTNLLKIFKTKIFILEISSEINSIHLFYSIFITKTSYVICFTSYCFYWGWRSKLYLYWVSQKCKSEATK